MSKQTQIVATIGPGSDNKETFGKMVDAGLSIVRLNFSWGTHDEHANYIKMVREVAEEKGVRIPILQDLSGPRVQDGAAHGMNPDIDVITEKDLKDLDFGVKQKVDYIALSFVGDADDVVQLKKEIADRGGDIPVIAKIERADALEKAESIMEAADGMMIARGDLGDNTPFETLPFSQKRLVKIAKDQKKPIITATEMMESMINNPRPTRAEVTDVAYAVMLQTDAVMLSAESAVGKYPVETITAMTRVIVEAEKHTESNFNLLA